MEPGIIWEFLPLLMQGLWVTVAISALAIFAALLMGAVLVALEGTGKKPVVAMVRAYTETMLGTPVLILLYVVYFVGPDLGIRIPGFQAGLLALGLYYAPYMAEIIRGAMATIPAGQIEAARALGLSRWQVARHVILPQTVGQMIPPLTGISIGLVKDSAIVSVISVHELAFQTKQAIAETYAPFEFWAFAAFCYWVMLFAFDRAMRRLERTVTRYRTGEARVATGWMR